MTIVALSSRGLVGRRAGVVRRRERSGNIEYSVVLTIVCGLALVVAAGLGRTIWARIQGVNSAWASDVRRAPSAKGVGEPGGTPTANRPAANAPLPRQYATLAVCLLIAGGCCGATYVLGGRSRRFHGRATRPPPGEVSESQFLDTENKLFAKRQDLLRMLHSNVELLATSGIAVRHLMTSHPVTALPETSVKEIVPLMKDNRVHHVLVCGSGRELLGVISDRDLHGRCGRTAQQIMTPKPDVVSPDTPLGTAISHLVTRQISCLPVVEAGRLRGVLTTTDLVLVAHAFLQLSLSETSPFRLRTV